MGPEDDGLVGPHCQEKHMLLSRPVSVREKHRLLLASWKAEPLVTQQRQPQGVMEWSVPKTEAKRKNIMVGRYHAVIGIPLPQQS